VLDRQPARSRALRGQLAAVHAPSAARTKRGAGAVGWNPGRRGPRQDRNVSDSRRSRLVGRLGRPFGPGRIRDVPRLPRPGVWPRPRTKGGRCARDELEGLPERLSWLIILANGRTSGVPSAGFESDGRRLPRRRRERLMADVGIRQQQRPRSTRDRQRARRRWSWIVRGLSKLLWCSTPSTAPPPGTDGSETRLATAESKGWPRSCENAAVSGSYGPTTLCD